MKRLSLALTTALLLTQPALANENTWQEKVMSFVDQKASVYDIIALDIGRLAEIGYLEIQSSKRLSDHLKAEGFKVENGVANMPTGTVKVN
ncbi:MAG: hypothetical protein COB36_11385 [Alphaproteobacteria bacterium]|nr:MAG: hypothetical protein COB36_11385 [Alphaproteobacteria bacterium]